MWGDMLKARRIVIQAVCDVGGAENVNVSKEMLSYTSSARAKYQEYLDDQKKHEEVQRISKKRKAEEAELSDMKSKRQRLFDDYNSLQESADRLAEEVAKKKMSLLLESNALRKRAKELQTEAQNLEKVLKRKKQSEKSVPVD